MNIKHAAFLFMPPLAVLTAWSVLHTKAPRTSPPVTSSSLALVVRVVDGDTFDWGAQRVRLWGIDAPEKTQKCYDSTSYWMCGEEAKRLLTAKIVGKKVVCAEKDKDRSGRTVAVCTINGEDIAADMVQEGWAVDWPKYSNGAYSSQELVARSRKVGIFRGP